MSEFKEVTVIKKANIYFDGKVTSRTVMFQDGSKKTLGIMLPGDYAFDTDAKELIEIQAGSLEVLLPDSDQWQTFTANTSFVVPAQSSFKLKVTEATDYCCSYLP